MSLPFFIWTMQRTGGTALTDLLMEMSEHRGAEHEPFNWSKTTPRQFWPIADAWNRDHDEEALAGALRGIFAQHYLIKHCYELFRAPFNERLVQSLAKTHYRHIQLLRRDECARLMSKFVAEAQGTWFRDYARRVYAEIADGTRTLDPVPIADMVRHYHHCRRASDTVAAWLTELGPDARIVYFEDLFEGDRDARLFHLRGLFDFLGFTADEVERHRHLIEAKIFHAGQDTRSTVATYLPNYREACRALAEAGCGGPSVAEAPPRRPPLDARVAAEFARFVERQETTGPYLQIGVGDPARCGLAQLSGERHALGQGLEPGVTDDGIVCHAGGPADLNRFVDGQFETVMWNGALAHDRAFWRTLDELRRILASGGTLILSVPGFSNAPDRAGVTIAGPKGHPIPDTTPTYRIHGAPDFWRISPQAMRQVVLEGFDQIDVKVTGMPPRIFGVGVKPGLLRSAAE